MNEIGEQKEGELEDRASFPPIPTLPQASLPVNAHPHPRRHRHTSSQIWTLESTIEAGALNFPRFQLSKTPLTQSTPHPPSSTAASHLQSQYKLRRSLHHSLRLEAREMGWFRLNCGLHYAVVRALLCDLQLAFSLH